MKKIKVFIDSNVWFSAFHSPKSTCSQLIEKLLKKKFEVVVSQQILEEIVRNIRAKLPQILPLVEQFFLNYPTTILKNPAKEEIKKFQILADKKDAFLIASAGLYHCQYFITGNVKDFKILPIKQKYHLMVLKPKVFLAKII